MQSHSILGNPVRRREDPALLRGEGAFVGNVELEGLLHVAFVRSTMAHAEIGPVDLDEVRSLPGVVAALAAADVPFEPQPPSFPLFPSEFNRPPLASGRVRFVGEPVAVLVAEDPYVAVDAAELVFVDYEPLRVVVSATEAVADETLLFPEAGTNVCLALPGETIDFSACDVVASAQILNQRIASASIEPRVAASSWDGQRLTHWASCQGAHSLRDAIAAFCGLATDDVRVISADVGGGFGAKASANTDELVVAWLATQLGRPVRWVETRTESMLGFSHGRAQHQEVMIGGTADGRITHYHLDVIQDAGAYPGMGGVLPTLTGMMAPGVYDIDNVEYSCRSVVTNTTPVGAYRGAGRPEAAAAIERAVDLFAAEAGLDPVEVRRRNYIAPEKFPHANGRGFTYDCGDYAGSLDRAIAAAGLEDLRAEQQARRDRGERRALGIGLATYVEVTALNGGTEYASVTLRPDGTMLAKTGSNPYGQGHHTTWAMIVSEQTGLPLDRIEVVHGDTDLVPRAVSLTGGSRSVQLAGSAMNDASERLVDAARERAADLLEAAVDDVVLDRSTAAFHVVGTPTKSVGWDDVAGATVDAPLSLEADIEQADSSFPFGTHVAVVEVDLDTGGVELVRLVAVDDAGTIINPLIAAGQVHGGLAQGAAQALLEEIIYDDDGNPLTTNFADYAAVSAAEMPEFERIVMETPTPLNPLGAKGIGESGTVGSTPAVQNAVVDALAHLGVRHIDMPLTPEKIWRALGSEPPS